MNTAVHENYSIQVFPPDYRVFLPLVQVFGAEYAAYRVLANKLIWWCAIGPRDLRKIQLRGISTLLLNSTSASYFFLQSALL